MNKTKELKFAVILSGCGFLDGAEIRESVLTLLALDTYKVSYDIFAPNKNMHHVIDHAKQSEQAEERNVLVESARIARGNIHDLNDLKAENYDGLVIPGGFGVAKNLCSFAFDGENATVENHVKEALVNFHGQKKPITAICIAPALVALSLKGVKLTVGTCTSTADVLEKLGAKHQTSKSDEWIIDHDNMVISTPAYMDDKASLDVIFKGISGAIKAQIDMARL